MEVGTKVACLGSWADILNSPTTNNFSLTVCFMAMGTYIKVGCEELLIGFLSYDIYHNYNVSVEKGSSKQWRPTSDAA